MSRLESVLVTLTSPDQDQVMYPAKTATSRNGDNVNANGDTSKRRQIKDVVTPYTHISEASRYILYTIILTFDGICTLS